ncbi:pyrroline-5-carboxylate reductase [Bowmanella yangjiangensis]|uniref:Pyrroline-5-carboxylate reductase n=1 Tax=Bowmanella yangjiangensis TaxID=2811230 RepID=A0ABS3CMP1_9ALTE|nr:pyrroline-5-carboxylate reductase [Bowmanella yangjiangensis]MBN7818312.1 pyrroline-5-carboxylate reductase [Bowmanella yangjiangensis]
MQHRKITFIGAGNMSRSIISGMVKSGYPAEKITASNPSRPKLDALQQEFGIAVCQDNLDASKDAEVVVLAVKPQLMEVATAPLKTTDLAGKLFISIAAGLPVTRLQAMLGGTYPVVRTMPNTPSAMGLGMTGLYADAQVSQADRSFAQDLLAQVGQIAWVEEESMMDAVTAAAGSSPAYFFLFLEAMQDKAMELGFDRQTARLLVQQAMLGAANMVCHNPGLELAELRAQVTSKGGTTAAAIEQFEQQGLRSLVADAMQAAVDRASVMSKAF